jgi:RND family efflux transporter MFP subunit
MSRFILFTATLFIIFSCSDPGKGDDMKIAVKPNVRTGVITRDSVSISIQAVGTLASKTQSNLSFLTGGIISEYKVLEGDIVNKGELLAKLDITEIQSRTRQASLALEKASRDFRRAENLYRDSVITLEQYQNAKTALDVAEENYQIAQFNKRNSEIRAPSDGKILKKLKETNEITAPGHPVLIFASTEADWILNVNLSDRDIVKINQGDSAIITFDAYPDNQFSAVINEIANVANPLSGTYEVELKLLRLPDRLVTGLIGKAKIIPQAKSVLFLPPEGLVEATGRKGIVFKLQNGNALRTEVEIFEITKQGIILRSGLDEGDTVITDGNVWLHNGETPSVVY